VFQQFNLIAGISVLENVTLPAYTIGMPRKQRRERAMELLDRFSIANKAHVKVESLSGGGGPESGNSQGLDERSKSDDSG